MDGTSSYVLETMDEDDVPQLVTLDEHISQQIDTRLSLDLDDVDMRDNVEGSLGKVPITILTGIDFSFFLTCRISWVGQDDITELHPE